MQEGLGLAGKMAAAVVGGGRGEGMGRGEHKERAQELWGLGPCRSESAPVEWAQV